MATHKLDIFDVLNNTDNRNFDYYQSLDLDEQKSFVPSVTLRWMSGMSDSDTSEIALLILNEVANTNFFDLYQHPELQYKLLASSGLGSRTKHKWLPLPKSRNKVTKVHDFLSSQYPHCNQIEIDLILSKHTKQSFDDFMVGCGVEPKEAKELLKIFNDITKKQNK